jgi:transitional endoplasmic reticulum ATPase
MPLAEDVSLEKLAEITHGFVGADLAALCREAAMVTLRAIADEIPLNAEFIPFELLSRLEVSMGNFLEALTEIEPSALREVFTEVPDVTWNDVGGLDEAKTMLKQVIEWPLAYPALFERADAAPPKGVILTGKTGTGKTLLAKAVAHECGVNFISIKGPELFSMYVGESERMVRDIFRKARLSSPCIIFFDEIEAIAGRRGNALDSSVRERMISQILLEMDGIEELRGVVVLAATNRPDLLDTALLRAGRFEVRIELPEPDLAGRRSILEVHTRTKPLADDVDLDRLAEMTEGYTGSDLESICRRASMEAIQAFLEAGLDNEDAARMTLSMSNFLEAIDEVKLLHDRVQGTASSSQASNLLIEPSIDV